MLSDLKECVTGDAKIKYRGGEKTIKDIYEKQEKVEVKSFDVLEGTIKYRKAEKVIDTGFKECLRLKTKSGRTIVLSKDTPIFTNDGWIKAKDIRVGQRVGLDISAS